MVFILNKGGGRRATKGERSGNFRTFKGDMALETRPHSFFPASPFLSPFVPASFLY